MLDSLYDNRWLLSSIVSVAVCITVTSKSLVCTSKLIFFALAVVSYLTIHWQSGHAISKLFGGALDVLKSVWICTQCEHGWFTSKDLT